MRLLLLVRLSGRDLAEFDKVIDLLGSQDLLIRLSVAFDVCLLALICFRFYLIFINCQNTSFLISPNKEFKLI